MQETQGAFNTDLWRSADRLDDYRGDVLRPVEQIVIDDRAQALRGRVLEVGCGAGRITQHLARLSERLEAFDVSPRMVGACALACPTADVHEGDLRDLSRYPLASYDAIWAGFNIIDILSDAGRGQFLHALRERLVPTGLLVFSSHNLAGVRPRNGPPALVPGNLRERADAMLRLPRRLRNHRRTAPFEYRAASHAVLADEENDFAGLHYYVGRAEQERQLRDRGLLLEECRDLDGALVPPGAQAPTSPELHYVARPASTL